MTCTACKTRLLIILHRTLILNPRGAHTDETGSVAMTTEVVYDEAEPFQTYNPALQSPHDIYSNSGEFDAMVGYSSSDDGRGACTGAVQPPNESPDIAIDKRPTSCSGTPVDGITFLDEVVKDLEAKQQEGSNETASRDIPVSWNVKLRNNWKRKLRRDAAAATEQKYKKSDNRPTITGSLSRLVISVSKTKRGRGVVTHT